MKVILASRNKGKLREFQALFNESGLELMSLDDWPEVGELTEKGSTFLDNAREKAWQVVEKTGQPAMADDSGLVVEALDGRPGVHSARYAGPDASPEDRNRKLLGELEGVADADRQAAFVCVLVLAWPQGREIVAEGRCEGYISLEPKGGGGFGYDPVFYLPEYGATMAQLDPAVKNRISHRARASAEMKEILKRESVGE